MNIHTRLIGALDAVMLSAAALVTVAFTAALFHPPSDRHAYVDGDVGAAIQTAQSL
jgi:hypothetical protein